MRTRGSTQRVSDSPSRRTRVLFSSQGHTCGKFHDSASSGRRDRTGSHHFGDQHRRLAHHNRVTRSHIFQTHLVLVVQSRHRNVEPPTNTGSRRRKVWHDRYVRSKPGCHAKSSCALQVETSRRSPSAELSPCIRAPHVVPSRRPSRRHRRSRRATNAISCHSVQNRSTRPVNRRLGCLD